MTDKSDGESRQLGATIARLELALVEETRTSAALRDSLTKLQKKVAEIEKTVDRRLDEAGKRAERAEAKFRDQQVRLSALGTGREDTMRALSDTRAELARVRADRNQMQKKLAVLDDMQTETIVLSDDRDEEARILQALPSLEELMASLNSIEEIKVDDRDGRFAHSGHSSSDSPEPDMIAANLIFPEEFEAEQPQPVRTGRVLVYLDAHPPIKYPLYKNVITIGRSTAADIQIDDDFVSRVHARIVSDDDCTVVEDVDSKNGIKVNSKLVARHALRHGDIIGLGKLRFTFVETAES